MDSDEALLDQVDALIQLHSCGYSFMNDLIICKIVVHWHTCKIVLISPSNHEQIIHIYACLHHVLLNYVPLHQKEFNQVLLWSCWSSLQSAYKSLCKQNIDVYYFMTLFHFIGTPFGLTYSIQILFFLLV